MSVVCKQHRSHTASVQRVVLQGRCSFIASSDTTLNDKLAISHTGSECSQSNMSSLKQYVNDYAKMTITQLLKAAITAVS